MSLYAWVDSFTVHVLRHTESTTKKLGKIKRIKINKIIAKQITEDEKLVITTINQTYTSTFISAGDYQRNDLINLLAQTPATSRPRNISHQSTRESSLISKLGHGIPAPLYRAFSPNNRERQHQPHLLSAGA
jgi:hypothetical protein